VEACQCFHHMTNVLTSLSTLYCLCVYDLGVEGEVYITIHRNFVNVFIQTISINNINEVQNFVNYFHWNR